MEDKKFFDLNFQEKKLLSNIKLFASHKFHAGQQRDEGGSYILHGIRVANYLLELLEIKDADIICAALLHDTVEDTPLPLKKVEKLFGGKVSYLVDSVTRKKLPDETEENRFERKYQNFLAIMKKNLDARSIKACDWLDNMTSWSRIPTSNPVCKKLPDG